MKKLFVIFLCMTLSQTPINAYDRPQGHEAHNDRQTFIKRAAKNTLFASACIWGLYILVKRSMAKIAKSGADLAKSAVPTTIKRVASSHRPSNNNPCSSNFLILPKSRFLPQVSLVAPQTIAPIAPNIPKRTLSNTIFSEECCIQTQNKPRPPCRYPNIQDEAEYFEEEWDIDRATHLKEKLPALHAIFTDILASGENLLPVVGYLPRSDITTIIKHPPRPRL